MTFTGTLLPYQPDAVNRMVERKKLLVAYDLGLGKTPITIAAIENLMDSGDITRPGLVVCLSSLKYQWASQIETFTSGTSKSLVVDGTKKQRLAQYEIARDWVNSGVDYVIMNYETVVADYDEIVTLPRGFMALDEGTAIKNFKSQRSKRIKAMRLKCPVRFVLTGTPIENGKPEELFSIMQFVDPEVLGSYPTFDKAFIVRNALGGVNRYSNLPTLHKRLKEAMVRKSQNDPDVAPFLPETIMAEPIRVPLDHKASKLYRFIVSELVEELEEATHEYGAEFDINFHYSDSAVSQWDPRNRIAGSVMSKIVCLRLLCDHPALLKKSADTYDDPNSSLGSSYASSLRDRGLLEGLNKGPKIDALVEFMNAHFDSNPKNKGIVFSSFVLPLDLISKALGEDRCVVYSGKIDAKTKNELKERFNTDPKIRCFVSSDAGGYGVDLPAANLSVNFDLPWSSGVAIQRNGRARRASSKWPSLVIQDFLIAKSIEERQWLALQHKHAVASAIVDGKGIDATGGVSMSLGSLLKFLKNNDA